MYQFMNHLIKYTFLRLTPSKYSSLAVHADSLLIIQPREDKDFIVELALFSDIIKYQAMPYDDPYLKSEPFGCVYNRDLLGISSH